MYVYGLERISQYRQFVANNQNQTQASYYAYDGHGSVRALTDPSGNVTDTYDYDAFGNLIHSTATGIPPCGTTVTATPNEFLFAGEQFDSDLNLYYNRARYLSVSTSRFWTMDTFEGTSEDPPSLHKYPYAASDPVNRADPSGRDFYGDLSAAVGIIGVLASQALPLVQNIAYAIYFNLYRVPQVIDTVANALAILQAATYAALTATNVVERLASNLQSTSTKFPVGPSPMGSAVEDAFGANLARGTQSYDYYDQDTQTVVRMKGTRQISSAQALLNVFKQGIANLNSAPEEVRTTYRNGAPVTIVRSGLRSRVVMVAIPEEPVSWDFRAFMIELEALEQQEQMILKAVPAAGLD